MLCICLQITLIVVNIYVELNKSDLKTVSVCDKVAVGIFWLNIKAKKDLNYNLSCIWCCSGPSSINKGLSTTCIIILFHAKI